MLDDKRPEVRAQTANAPYIVDYLCGDCKAHHDTVRALLTSLNIPFEDAPRLVRGLDYYMRTTYEFDHALLGAQSGIGGGGRYDGLSEDIGGPSLPGIGFAVGLDRIVLAIESERGEPGRPRGHRLPGLRRAARRRTRTPTCWRSITALRRAGVRADMAFGSRGLKGAMKAADRSGARFAVLIGAEEKNAGLVQMKDLKSGDQEHVAATSATDWLLSKLSGEAE